MTEIHQIRNTYIGKIHREFRLGIPNDIIRNLGWDVREKKYKIPITLAIDENANLVIINHKGKAKIPLDYYLNCNRELIKKKMKHPKKFEREIKNRLSPISRYIYDKTDWDWDRLDSESVKELLTKGGKFKKNSILQCGSLDINKIQKYWIKIQKKKTK